MKSLVKSRRLLGWFGHYQNHFHLYPCLLVSKAVSKKWNKRFDLKSIGERIPITPSPTNEMIIVKVERQQLTSLKQGKAARINSMTEETNVSNNASCPRKANVATVIKLGVGKRMAGSRFHFRSRQRKRVKMGGSYSGDKPWNRNK